MSADMPAQVYLYKTGRLWVAVCRCCVTCVGVSRRSKNVLIAASAHQCEGSGPLIDVKHDAPFRHVYLPPRMLTSICNSCSSCFHSPRYEVLLIVERVHHCPAMKKRNQAEPSSAEQKKQRA